jgi:signal transduction histidine kinase
LTDFDLPTAYFVAGTMFLTMPIAIGMLLRNTLSRTIKLWSMGGLLFGVSLILMGLRTLIPDVMSFGLANTLLFLSTTLWLMALRHQLNKPISLPWAFVATLIFGAIYNFFQLVLASDYWRFIWSASIDAAMLIWIAALARQIGQRDRSFSAHFLSVVYLVLGTILGLRAVNVLMGWAQPGVLETDYLSVALIVVGVTTSIVGNIGFVGMVMEGMVREALLSAKEKARQEEASRLVDQMAQLDRRRSVGEIAASLGHELSQPLTNLRLILDSLSMAMQERQDNSLNRYLQDMDRNTQKASDILNRIRSFIRSQPRTFEQVDLGLTIAEVTALIQSLTHKESVQIEVRQPKQPVSVLGDAVQLSQVLMNVLRNAIEATAKQPERHVEIQFWQQHSDVWVTIRDNGPGLLPEVAAQISAPFFSTKPHGLGVGLSISKSIAQQHGGDLLVQNHPGGGVLAQLRLPAQWPHPSA